MAAPRSKGKRTHRRPAGEGAPDQPPSVNDIEKANKIDFKPRNPRQRLHYRSIKTNPVTVVFGDQGTGKTFVSVVAAVEMFLKGDIKKIVVVRPAVAAAGEEHGFLPGDISKKLAPWARPVFDKMQKLMGQTRFLAAVAAGAIEAMPFTYMRGLEFEDAFVLLDEAQNCSRAQLELFTGRFAGTNSKCVIDGDIRQTDLPGESGLAILVEVIRDCLEGIDYGLVEYGIEDIERGPITAAFARAWKAYDHAA